MVNDRMVIIDAQGRAFTNNGSGGFVWHPHWNDGPQLKQGMYPAFAGIRRDVGVFAAVGPDGKLYANGNEVKAPTKWTAGTVYGQGKSTFNGIVYITDANGILWQINGDGRYFKKNTTLKLPANRSYSGGYFVDASGKIQKEIPDGDNKTADQINQQLTKQNIKLSPEQYDIRFYVSDNYPSRIFAADTSGKLIQLRLSEDGTTSTKYETQITGLTPGMVYGGDYFNIVDGAGEIWICQAAEDAPCNKLSANTNIHLPAGTTSSNIYDPINNGLPNRLAFASDSEGLLYAWNGDDWILADFNGVNLKIKPGQLLQVASNNSDANPSNTFTVKDDDGNYWHGFGRVTSSTGMTLIPSLSGNMGDRAVCAGQLPQSGDPAASWMQTVPYVVAVLAIVGAVTTVAAAKRRII